MCRLPFASLAFVLFLASNLEASDLNVLKDLVYKAIGDIGGLKSKVEVKVIDVNCKYLCISKSIL